MPGLLFFGYTKVNMFRQRKLISASFVLLLSLILLFIGVSWWSSSSDYVRSGEVALLLIAAGRLVGLIGVLFALLQFILMARLPILERAFGQDKLSRLHRITGYVTFTLVALHPALIVNGNALLTGKGVPGQYIFMIQTYNDLIFAAIASLSLYALVFSSIWIVRKHLRYEWWRTVHFLSYAFISLAFLHQIELGTTITSQRVFNYFWLCLYFGVAAVFGYYRILRPVLQYKKYRFKVARVVAESPSVTSVYITGRGMEAFKWKSGQFALFTFLQKGIPLQAHPFSISWAPQSRDEIRITVKSVGDFTNTLKNLVLGTRVIVQGPFGVFGQQVEDEKQVLLVAGGIGITPLRALFERYARHGRDVILLYAVQKPEDFVLKTELDDIADSFSNANVIYLCENPAGHSSVVKGRIDASILHEYAPNIPGRRAFVCGPVGMMNAVKKLLIEAHMPEEKIFSERFSFLK